MGGNPVLSIFGESVPVMSARHSINWIWNSEGTDLIPIFILTNPVNTLRNKFVRRWFERDLRWALTCDLDSQWFPPLESVHRIVETEADALLAEREIRQAGGMTFDTETAGRIGHNYYKVLCVAAMAYGDPLENPFVWTESALADERLLAPLRRLLEDPAIKLCGHNLKYDVQSVKVGLDIRATGTDNCTMLTRKLLWSDSSGKLEHLDYSVGMGGHKREAQMAIAKACESITKARTKSTKAVGFLPGTVSQVFCEAIKYHEDEPKAFAYGLIQKDLLHRYCGLDVVATERLRVWQEPQLEKKQPIKRIWNKVVRDTTEAVAQVELWGVPVDRQAVQAYDSYLEVRVREIEKKFENYNVNPGSPAQLAKLLYDKLDLPCRVYTDTGAESTNEEALKAIEDQHPIVRDIMNYRELSHLKNTYAGGLYKHIRDDGRVHPTIHIDGAASGRASASKPNIQNQPSGLTEHAKLVRNCFVALPGHKLIQLDYSSLELRIAAMLSGDPVMKQIFFDGVDYHMQTAILICQTAWGITADQIEKKHRTGAKTANFAILYGKTIKGIAKQIGCSVEKAEEIVNAIFGKMRDLKSWIDDRIAETNRTGVTWTWWDGKPARCRHLWRIASTDEESSKSRGTAERSSYNTPIQGTAAEYCTASLVSCVNWLLDEQIPGELIVPVHDSLMFHVPDDHVDLVAHRAHDTMLSWNSLDVPLAVDVEVGQTWGSLEKYQI
jgi:DNA polymerase-1